jgi:hypothetical protein
MKRFVILILFLPTIAFAQSDTTGRYYSISGTVKDILLQNPLEYSSVSLLSSEDSSFIKATHSDISGGFVFQQILQGEYVIRIVQAGYKPTLTKIILDEDRQLKVDLIKEDIELDEVAVSGEKPLYRVDADKRVYLTANDESIQNAFAVDALENTPGVYTSIDGAAMVRGKSAAIWINGKPTKKSALQLESYLKLIPASRIERIEVITNPSAHYTATNTNSIVNIVLKKKTDTNNLLAIGTLINTDNLLGLWATGYITTKKFELNIYWMGSIASRDYRYYDKSFSIMEGDTAFYSEYTKEKFYSHLDNNINAEMTYHLNEKADLNVVLGYEKFTFTESFETSSIRRYQSEENRGTNIFDQKNIELSFFNVDFTKYFQSEDNILTINVTGENTDWNNVLFYKNAHSLIDTTTAFWRSSPDFDFFNLEIKADYAYPFKEKYLFSAGFLIDPGSHETYTSNVETSQDSESGWTDTPILSNVYDQSISSYEMYGSFSGDVSGINYKLGLRYENVSYELKQSLPFSEISKVYPNFYPSLGFSYETKSKHNFSLSYSRRVNNPIYNLNPYVDRVNDDYTSSGNPDLNFATINSYEFGYFKAFDKISLNSSVYLRNTKNDISPVSEPVYDLYFDRSVVLNTYANCADSKFLGSELSLSYSPVKKIKLDLFADTYYQELTGSYKNIPVSDTGFVYKLKFNTTYKVSNNLILKLMVYYNSDKSELFQLEKSNFYTHASLKLDLFKKKLTLDIRARDIFKTQTMISEYSLPGFYHYSETQAQFQRVQFILIYRIGNPKFDRKAKIDQLSR